MHVGQPEVSSSSQAPPSKPHRLSRRLLLRVELPTSPSSGRYSIVVSTARCGRADPCSIHGIDSFFFHSTALACHATWRGAAVACRGYERRGSGSPRRPDGCAGQLPAHVSTRLDQTPSAAGGVRGAISPPSARQQIPGAPSAESSTRRLPIGARLRGAKPGGATHAHTCRNCAGLHLPQANVCPVKREVCQSAKGWRSPPPERREHRAEAPPEEKTTESPVTEEGGGGREAAGG